MKNIDAMNILFGVLLGLGWILLGILLIGMGIAFDEFWSLVLGIASGSTFVCVGAVSIWNEIKQYFSKEEESE